MRVFACCLFLSAITLGAHAQQDTREQKPFAQALQEVLNGPAYQSTLSEIQAIELEFESRDIVLEPTLELSAGRYNNNRELLANLNRKPTYDLFTATLSKPFSTGTTVSFSPFLEDAMMPNLTPSERSTAEWQVLLSQSLWQDFFGRSTRLRRAREDFERKEQLAAALRTRAMMLYEFESLYWDWALLLKQSELQNRNLVRSRQILRWVRDRLRRAAAENTDLLQAQAATTLRELNLAAVQQQQTQAYTRIERFVPGAGWQPAVDDLSKERPVDGLLTQWRPDELSEPAPLDFLVARNQAAAASERAKEELESTRPRLDFRAAYGKNAINPERNTALSESFDHTHEFSSLALVFSTGLDFGLQRKKVESAEAYKNAAARRLEATQAEKKVAWSQLQKEITDLNERIKNAQTLVALQTRKANAERENYRKGRSTAFQAITFEQEAIEAEITLWTLYALMRKTEAGARLFAR